MISEYNSLSGEILDGVGSLGYDQIWSRGLSAGIKDVGFELAGHFEDGVPSIYITTLGLDVCIEELYSAYGQLGRWQTKKTY